MKKFLFAFLAAMLAFAPSFAAPNDTETPADEQGKVNPKEIIFEHLGDGYGWEVPFNHHVRIPLPVIVFAKGGHPYCFMSNKLEHGATYSPAPGVEFKIAGKESSHKGKVVQLTPEGEYKPFDISITKNVMALFIAAILVIWSILAVARWHRRMGHKAPRKVIGLLELIITFIYDGVIRPTLKDKAQRFAPYLLTVFFLILYMNLLGLIVIFPGGANLTGNISVTLVLSVMTFLITNIFGTKHYWKEVFWPDVPLWLKFPIPIMPVIELFGVFTKPAALTVRLFANMMGGHIIVIVLTLLIFIFAFMGPAVTGATTVVSIVFSVFMLLIDVLVSFIQAYVFTMLSTLFIGLAQEKGHDEKHHEEAGAPAAATASK